MSYSSLVVIAGIGLAFLILSTHFIIGGYSQRRFWKSFTIAHLLFIPVVTVIYIFSEKDAQHQLYWLIPATIDLPISLLFLVLPLDSITAVFLAFLTLGTLQYAIIGWLIDLALTKPRKLLMPSKKVVISIIALLLIWSVLGYEHYLYTSLPESEKAEIELNDANSEIVVEPIIPRLKIS